MHKAVVHIRGQLSVGCGQLSVGSCQWAVVGSPEGMSPEGFRPEVMSPEGNIHHLPLTIHHLYSLLYYL